MASAALQTKAHSTHVDVLIAGAGISGIGSACHLKLQCPGKSFAVLESKDTFGGTWETHKYPGIRSDSDLYTFGYRFKPWVGAPIASAAEILKYMGEVIEEQGISEHIRFGHRITSCSWSSADNLWTVETTRKDGTVATFTAGYLWMCQGYYNHETPYLPEWAGVADYQGQFVHAMKWDPATDYTGKRVIVIGSGATAATVIPAMADAAAKVTMLQRSPTYFFAAPNVNELADKLRAGAIDEPTIHRVVRTQIMYDQNLMDKRCAEEPEAVVAELHEAIKGYGGEDFQFEPHFTPKYRIWQQRLAFVPNGDLFTAIGAGKVDVVTDTIDRFTPKGILTSSGQELEADIIIAATGFRLSVMGDIPFSVDAKPVNWADTVNYRGMMFTGVPNMCWVFGYFRASWTLRVDMQADFICGLLNEMTAKGAKRIDVALRPEDHNMAIRPWIEADNFNPGYLMRGIDQLPKSGDKHEWRHSQDYWSEVKEIPYIDLSGSEFLYDGVRTAKSAGKRVTEAA